MRVLHVDTETEWRGGQAQLALLVQGLGERGVDQQVVTPLGARLADRVQALEAPLVGRWRGRSALAEVIDRFRPDVVAVHTSHGHALAPANAPIVVHRRLDFPPSRWSYRRYRRSLGVIAVSRAVAEIVEVTGARVRVVHDGVASGPLASTQPSGGFLCVGALVPHKDHETLLRAMPSVQQRLDIVGEGPLRARLERLSQQLGITDRVRFLGHRSDVPALLTNALALVHPSKEEGLGQVVLEALIRGVPVVATRAGGLAEVVWGHGLLVPPQRPRALAAALNDMAHSHLRWRSHLGSGRRPRTWTADAMVDGTLQAYEDWTGIRA